MNKLYAEDINYWKTGQSSPDTWMDKAKTQIEKIGGMIVADGYGNEPMTGRSAYMLTFEIAGDDFMVIWPVLASKTENTRAAKIQAATMLYHDVKAKCISSYVLGSRSAFFSYLLLSSGQVASSLAGYELDEMTPAMFNKNQLTDGKV